MTTASPLRAGVLVDQTHRTLTQAILRGEYGPGQRLRDSQIAEQLGVSRAPVREALRLLDQEGLVRKEPNRSYRVVEFDDADTLELAAVRIGLETIAIRHLVHNRCDLSRAEAALQEVRRAAAEGEPLDISLADLAFHIELVAATGLARLISAYRPTGNQTMLAMRAAIISGSWTASRQSYELHRGLLTSVQQAQASGDPRPTLRLLEEHIVGGQSARLIGPCL